MNTDNDTTTRAKAKRLIAVASSSALALALGACTTYESVESAAVTQALDFDEANRIEVTVIEPQPTDTAFSERMRSFATEELIDELEDEGFDYSGERDPDLTVAFSSYVTRSAGVIDTSLEPNQRVTEKEITRTADGGYTTTTTTTVTTSRKSEPIVVDGPGRLFLLEIYDAKTEALLWRGYTMRDDVGLDRESLDNSIELLVERLEQET